jgi:hypothetical protein
MNQYSSFGTPTAVSLGALSDHSNQVGSTLFFVAAEAVDPSISEIEINFDCDLSFDPTAEFSGFNLTISNCSVTLRNFHFSQQINVENGFVAFLDCSFSNLGETSNISSSFSHILINDCEFSNPHSTAIVLESISTLIASNASFCKLW